MTAEKTIKTGDFDMVRKPSAEKKTVSNVKSKVVEPKKAAPAAKSTVPGKSGAKKPANNVKSVVKAKPAGATAPATATATAPAVKKPAVKAKAKPAVKAKR